MCAHTHRYHTLNPHPLRIPLCWSGFFVGVNLLMTLQVCMFMCTCTCVRVCAMCVGYVRCAMCGVTCAHACA